MPSHSENARMDTVIQSSYNYYNRYHPMLQDQFLEQIQGQVKSLIFDMYGNYVLLKCFETIPNFKLIFMLAPIEESIIYMAQQTYGCKILQKVIESFKLEMVIKMLGLILLLVSITD